MSKRRTIIIITSSVLLTITFFFLPYLSTVVHSPSAHISLVKSPFSEAKASDTIKADTSTPSLPQNAQENTLKEQPKTQNQAVQSSTPYATEGTIPTQQTTSSSIVLRQSANVVWSVPITERAVFITIDDGWFPSQSLLQMMQQDHFPVTAFLIQQAAQEHPDYWRAFVAAGGDIENHTLSHPDLTKITPANLANQLRTPMKYLGQFAAPPTLFRPPYGAFNSLVRQEVYQAGMEHLVMWDAVMSKGVLQTYNGKPIQPGSIILLHWKPGLSTQIKDLMGILQQEHLGIASLPVALAHPEKFPITWLTPEKNTQPVNSNSQQQPNLTKMDPSVSSDHGNGA